MIAVEIGGKPYTINGTKLPYFQSLKSFQHRSGQDTEKIIHSDIALFEVAYRGIEKSFRHCFRMLGTDLD